MIIYLASSSSSRLALLRSAGFSVRQFFHRSDEIIENKKTYFSVVNFVSDVVDLKMNSIDEQVFCNEADKENIDFFVLLVADTETMIDAGIILGKPLSLDIAKKIFLDMSKKSIDVSTAFKFNVFQKKNNNGILEWQKIATEKGFSLSKITISWTEEEIEEYINNAEKNEILNCSGGFRVEGRGFLYTKSIEGSFTNVLGLPMFELHNALKKYKDNNINKS